MTYRSLETPEALCLRGDLDDVQLRAFASSRENSEFPPLKDILSGSRENVPSRAITAIRLS
jgi:hypothetical protein